jgi:Gpi18-like mannosyltransferase
MHWDANWYTSIITDGYHLGQNFIGPDAGQTNLNFFPLFPALTWPLSLLLPAGIAGQIVANVFFLVGCFALHQFSRERFGTRIADYSVVSVCFFPGSFIFSASAPESLFFFLITLSFYQLSRSRWLLATIPAALLTITRSNGILILAPLGVEWLKRRRANTKTADFKSLFYIFAIPLPLCAFMFYLFWHFSDAFAFVNAQRHFWTTHFDWRILFIIHTDDIRQTMQKIMGLFLVLLFVSQAKHFSLAENTMVLLFYVLIGSNSASYQSLLRYLLPLFQIHQATGILAAKGRAGPPLIGGLAALNGLYMAYWVRGDAFFI